MVEVVWGDGCVSHYVGVVYSITNVANSVHYMCGRGSDNNYKELLMCKQHAFFEEL